MTSCCLLLFVIGFSVVASDRIQFEDDAGSVPSQTNRLMVVRCAHSSGCSLCDSDTTSDSTSSYECFVPSVTMTCDSDSTSSHWYDMYYGISWCATATDAVEKNDVYLRLDTNINDSKTFVEVLTVPISAYNLHGAYGNRHGYWWVYLVVTVVLASIYGLFARLRAWQALLSYAIAVYTAVGADNLYQAVISISAETKQGLSTPTSSYAFAIAAMSIGANLIPIVFCTLVMRYARCRPLPWSAFGFLAAFGSLFLAGAGWFVGPTLFGLGCVLRVVQRYY